MNRGPGEGESGSEGVGGARFHGPGRALSDLLERTLGVLPGEGRRTALCFLYLFCASAVFILGRTARDTLFLSRYSLKALPWMFVLFGVVSALVALLYGRIADRVPRRLQIYGALLVGGASYVGVWLLVRAEVHWIYPAFYVWTEVVANLLILQFWTLANDLHDPRSAKRLFGTIGSARILGVILVGLAAGIMVKVIGTANLILVLVALMAVMAAAAHGLFGEREAPMSLHAMRPRRERPVPVWRDAYVRSLAVVILLTFVSLTLGDYQFKVLARGTYTEDSLASFFSLFYATAGAVGFLFQLFATPRILRRYGVLAAMLVMPLFFAGSSGALLLLGTLAAATLMKFSDNAFQYTIHETSLQVLYVPFCPAVKARTRAILDTAVKPLAYGLGGLLLVFAAPLLSRGELSVRWLSLLTLPLAVLWLALLPRVRKLYLRALEASIAGRSAAFSVDHEFLLDSESRALLLKNLESGEASTVLHALDRLGGEDFEGLRMAHRDLASHPSPRVRQEALKRIAALRDEEGLEAAHGALADPDPQVHAAALFAVCELETDESMAHAEASLDHPEKVVRVAAVVGLINHGGIEGAVLGGQRLGALIRDESPKRRTEAAEIIRYLGPAGYRPLRRLLEDDSKPVRRAALKAAQAVADRRLVAVLLEALEDEGTSRRAGKALAAVGEPAVGPLVERLTDSAAKREARLQIPRILREIPARGTFEALLALPRLEDEQVRLRAYSTLGSLRDALNLKPLPRREVLGFLEEEVREGYALLASWEGARDRYETPLLKDSVELSLRRSRRRVLRLLALRHPLEEVTLVLRHLEIPGQGATALEILDALLEPPIKQVVLPYVEEAPARKMIERAGGLAPPPAAPLEFLRGRCAHPTPYGAFSALSAAAERGESGVLGVAEAATGSASPLVREGGLLALAAFAEPSLLAGRLDSLASDPDHAVASLAASLAKGSEGAMYSTVEKVLFLMGVPIFDKLSGEDLAPLARAAEVETHAAGGRIIREGEVGDALYVVMRGLVGIEKGGSRLATFGPKETFGEMAVLDAAVRSADAVALEDTELLKIGSEEFYDILHEQAEIAEGVIKVLTRRLREADAKLLDRS